MDSHTMTSTVSCLSTSRSCRVRNLAASYNGGLGKLISTLCLGYSHCFKPRNIFPRTVYASGNVKADSVGAMIQEQVREKRLEAARRVAQPALATTTEATTAAEATAENGDN